MPWWHVVYQNISKHLAHFKYFLMFLIIILLSVSGYSLASVLMLFEKQLLYLSLNLLTWNSSQLSNIMYFLKNHKYLFTFSIFVPISSFSLLFRIMVRTKQLRTDIACRTQRKQSGQYFAVLVMGSVTVCKSSLAEEPDLKPVQLNDSPLQIINEY